MKEFVIVLCLYLASQALAEAKYVPTNLDGLWNTFAGEFLSKPLQLDGPFEINLDEKKLSVHGSVDRLVINGLSGLTLHDWHVDEATSKIEFNLDLTELTSTGRYDVNGLLIGVFPLPASGNFKMDVQNIRVKGSVEFDQESKNSISVNSLMLQTRFGGLAIKLGDSGSEAEETLNEVLSVVLADLYYQNEEQIMSQVSNLIKTTINEIILKSSQLNTLIQSDILSNRRDPADSRVDISGRVDSIFSSIRINASNGGWDPIYIRPASDEFSVTLYGATLNGAVSLSNVRIGGFSTIHRTGVCTTEVRPGRTTVVVFVGGNDIEIGLDVGLSFGIIKLNIQVEMIVRHVDLKASVVVNTNDFGVSLNEFLLNEIGTIKITIGGIPGGGSKVISNRISLLSNLVKDSLRYAFQEALRPSVEKAIEGPFFREFLTKQLLL